MQTVNFVHFVCCLICILLLLLRFIDPIFITLLKGSFEMPRYLFRKYGRGAENKNKDKRKELPFSGKFNS